MTLATGVAVYHTIAQVLSLLCLACCWLCLKAATSWHSLPSCWEAFAWPLNDSRCPGVQAGWTPDLPDLKFTSAPFGLTSFALSLLLVFR